MFLGPLLIVGVVQQARVGPKFGIGRGAAVLGSRRPHHDFHGPGVLEQGIRFGPGVESG